MFRSRWNIGFVLGLLRSGNFKVGLVLCYILCYVHIF